MKAIVADLCWCAIGLALFALLATGCSGERREVHSSAECQEAGGKWMQVCLSRQYRCVRDYADGGKNCRDSSECEGSCVVDLTTRCAAPGKCTTPVVPEAGTPVFGTCERDDNPCGTQIIVEDGLAGRIRHID